MTKETLKLYPVEVHGQIHNLLNECGVTIEEYLLHHHGSLLPDARGVVSELADPFFDEEEFRSGPDDDDEDMMTAEEIEQEFLDAREEFINEYLESIMSAKKLRLDQISDADLDGLEVDIDDHAEFLSELKQVGVRVKSMSVWQAVAAVKAGERIAEDLHAADIGVALAGGVVVSGSQSEWENWQTITLYTAGKMLAQQVDPDGSGESVSITAIVGSMQEMIDEIMQSSPQVMAIHGRVLADATKASETVKQYVPLLNKETNGDFYPYPGEAHAWIIHSLEHNAVSWDELLFALGNTILPLYSPSLFRHEWFAQFAVAHIEKIAQKKQQVASVDFSPIASVLRYEPEQIFLTAWEEEILSHALQIPDTFAVMSNEWERQYLQFVERLASVPFLITEFAREKTEAYLAYVLAKRQVNLTRGQYSAAHEVLTTTREERLERRAKRIQENIQKAPNFQNEAREVLGQPEIAQIFAEIESGLSFEVTQQRIKWAKEEQRLLGIHGLDDASRRLMDAFANDE